MADESSQRPRATGLIAALGEIVCDGELPVCERGCSEPCKACAMLFVLADRLEEETLTHHRMHPVCKANAELRQKAEREVERLRTIVNAAFGPVPGGPQHWTWKETVDHAEAALRETSK